MSIPVIVTDQHRSDEELFLDLRVSASVIDQFVEQANEAIARQNGINPETTDDLARAVAEKLGDQVAVEVLANTVMNMAAPFGRSAVEGVQTVGSPRFIAHGKVRPGKDFEFTASWALLPRAELTSYDPVEFTAPAIGASDEDVDEAIQQMLAQQAQFVPTKDTSAIARGDVCKLSLHTTLKGTPVDGLCFDERVYTTGAGNMPDEFEDNIIGMKPGETKSFDFEGISKIGPDDEPIMDRYEATATVLSKLAPKSPELTDAWVAKNIAGCKTVEELRAQVAASIEGQQKDERRHYLNYLAASELAKRFEGHIPDAAYEAIREQLQAELDASAQAAHMSTEQFLQTQGMNEQQFGVRMILEAHDRLAQQIALDAYARHFGITVDEADLVEFYRVQAPKGQEQAYRQQVEGSGHAYLAREGALRLKTSDYLVAHATIHEGSPYEDGAEK